MKLQYIHRGLQFFFITVALEGRPQVLSRLVEGVRRPTLTAEGEVVQALLVALHGVFPAVRLSDYVIMPDHVHFLMICDYETNRAINPLWVSFVLMEAIECAWAQNARGQAPEPPEQRQGETTPEQRQGETTPAAVLSEALNAARRVAAEIEALEAQGVSKPEARRLARERVRAAGVRGLAPEPSAGALRFERRCYIELSFGSRQLKTIRRYIRLNPARKLWKLAHPDRFVCFQNIRHAILDPSRRWQGMGDLTLLGSPFLFHVRLTLKKSVAEHEAAIAEIVAKAKRGMIPVSGFISPGEVEALRRLKIEPHTRFVRMMPCSLPPSYDPSAEDSRELAADRLLILSGFTDTPAVPARDIRRCLGASHQFRQNCLMMNDLAAALCAKAEGAVEEERNLKGTQG